MTKTSSSTSEPPRPDRGVKIVGNSKAIEAALRKAAEAAARLKAAG